jgi:hypothetical protein
VLPWRDPLANGRVQRRRITETKNPSVPVRRGVINRPSADTLTAARNCAHRVDGEGGGDLRVASFIFWGSRPRAPPVFV